MNNDKNIPQDAAASMLCHLAEKGNCSELEQQLTSQSCWLKTQSGTTPLMCAARADGNPQDCHATCAVLLLTEAGDRHDRKRMANAAGTDGIGCLHLAAASDNVQVAEKLLQAGAKVNAGDSWGRSPLMFAVARGNGRTAELLLKTGADPLQKDSTGQTPMQLARDLKSDVMEQLMQRWIPIKPMVKGDFREADKAGRVTIGSDISSTVYSLQTEPADLPVAVRILPQFEDLDKDRVGEIARSLGSLKAVKHTSIAQFFKCEAVDTNWEIVFELVDGRTLTEMLEQGPLAESETRSYGFQIASALSYLHNHPSGPIVHGNISSNTVRITSDAAVKLVDLSCRAMTGSGGFSRTQEASVDNGFTCYSDIWDFGCVLHAMAAGAQRDKLSDANDLDGRHSVQLQELHKQCTLPDPLDRITAAEIVLHDFFEELDNSRTVCENRISETNALMIAVKSTKAKLAGDWESEAESLTCALQQIADVINSVTKATAGGKVAGTVVAVAGGVTALVGAVLVIPSFGAALPLVIVGSSVAAAGSLGSAASEISKKVLQNRSHTEAVAKIDGFKVATENMYFDLLTDICDIVQRKILASSCCTVNCDVDFNKVKELMIRLDDEIRDKALTPFLHGDLKLEDQLALQEKFSKWLGPIKETLNIISEGQPAIRHLKVDEKQSDEFCAALTKAVVLFEKMLRILLFGSTDEPSEAYYEEIRAGLRAMASGVHMGIEAAGSIGRALAPRVLGIVGASIFTVVDVAFLIYYSKQMHTARQGQNSPMADLVLSHRARCITQKEKLVALANTK